MWYYTFITNGSRKPTLVYLCQAAVTTVTDVDYPTNPGILLSTVNLSILPLINTLDIYNYYMNFDNTSLREVWKQILFGFIYDTF